MSEVYYPNGQTPNTRELDFAVTDGSSWTQLETDPTVDRIVKLADPKSLTYEQVSTDHAGRWQLTKTYITDPDRASVLLDVSFKPLKAGTYQLFTLYDPSLAGDSGNDSGSTSGSALVASDTHVADTPVASALMSSVPFSKTSTGFVGTSDGATDLLANHTLTAAYPAAGPGNIAQVGQVPVNGKAGKTTHFTLALSFAADPQRAVAGAKASLKRPFLSQKIYYQDGWRQYVKSLNGAPRGVTGELAAQYWASVMAVKANEDKTYKGAFIASLTIPWGQAVDATGASGAGNGYHFVWARDEYEQATGLLAAGDTKAAKDAVTWLFTRQQQADGHFPQNSKVDGTPDQTNVQLDETAYPLILAWQVGQFNKTFYTEHIAKAADYLVATGPSTPQERWEETGGYSPSTIADEIAGLTAAAAIATKVDDKAGAAIYQATADSAAATEHRSPGPTPPPATSPTGEYYVRVTTNWRQSRRRRHPQLGQRRRHPPGERHRRRRLPGTDPARRQSTRRSVRRALADRGRPESSKVATPAGERVRSGTPTTVTAKPRTAPPGPASASAGHGRCCPVNAASTWSAPGATRCPTCKPWPTRPTPDS